MTTHITRMAVAWNMGTRTGIGSGSTGEWGNSAGSTVEQVVAAARGGLYGLRIAPSATSAKQSREFNLSQAWVMRFYFRYASALPSANADIHYVGQGSGAAQNGVQLRFRDSDDALIAVELDGTGAVTETVVGPTLVADQWYRVEYLYRCNTSFAWQTATDDDDATVHTGMTLAGTARDINSVFWGTNSAQTFNLHVADVYAAYSTDDGGENGAALAAEYPRGPGYGVRLVANSTTLTDAAKFSMSDGSTDTNAHTSMDDDPLIGGPGLRQDTVGASDYAEFGITDLPADVQPYAISIVAEGRTVGGGTSDATLKAVKDGAEQVVIPATNWNNGPQLISVNYLAGDSQTTPWTISQVNAMKVRWGYSGNVSNPPIIGGFVVTVDVSPTEDFGYWDVLMEGDIG